MSASKVHYCDKQMEMAVETHRLEPPTGKCRCRKYMNIKEATEEVARGAASWVVTKRTLVTVDTCSMCEGDKEIKNCANCNGTGLEAINGVIEHYGSDIVLVSRPGLDQQQGKNKVIRVEKSTPRKHPAIQTPRTPTIEARHIVRAYVSDRSRDLLNAISRGGEDLYYDGMQLVEGSETTSGMKYDRDQTSPEQAQAIRDRIEEYGYLIKDALRYQGKDRIPTIGVEPEFSREEDLGCGALRTCAFEESLVFLEEMVKDKPSLDGQKNLDESNARAARLKAIMAEVE